MSPRGCMWLESRWKMEVHVGVTGMAGAGESTFINAMQGLCDDDYGAAPIDIVDCAKAPTCYNYPADPNIKFWELPGIENPYFTDLETYRYKVQLDKYDTFLIFSCHRVTKSGRELIKEIRKNGKSFFFSFAQKSMKSFELRNEKDLSAKLPCWRKSGATVW